MSGNAPKLLIVGLVVLVVLFLVGVGVGAGNGIGAFSLDGAINTFSELIPSPAVSLDELTPDPSVCLDRTLQRIVVQGGGRCQLTIAPASANIRALKLQIAPGVSVQLELVVSPVKDNPLTITTDLPKDGKDQTTLDVYQSGGTLVIDQCSASSASTCVINLVS